MLENLKIIHEQMKDQYDLLILKMNVINQENFSLKRELYFYQNNSNNNSSINSNYNSNNNNQNINNNKIINNNFNTKEKEYPEKNVNININMNNIPKHKINNMKINIEDNNNLHNINTNPINNDKYNYNYYRKINKEKITNNDNIEINQDNLNNKNNLEYYNTINNSHRKFIRNINQNDSSGVSALLNNNNNNNKAITLYETKIKREKEKERDKTPILTHNNNKMQIGKSNINNISNISNINTNELCNYQKSNIKGKLNSNKKKITRTKSIDNKYNEESNYIKIKNKNEQISFIPTETNLKIEKQLEDIEKILIQLQKKRNIYLDQFDKLPEHPKKQKDLVEKKETKKIIDELNIAINEYKIKERNLKKLFEAI